MPGTGLHHTKITKYENDLKKMKDTSAVHIYSAGQLAMHQCTLTEVGTDAIMTEIAGAVRHSAWWLLVSEGSMASVTLNQSRFLNLVAKTFALCQFHADESPACDRCDFATNNSVCESTCAGITGDYNDCKGSMNATDPWSGLPSSMGKLLHVLENVQKVEIRSCVVQNLTIESKAGPDLQLGIVNSSFNPPLDTSLPTIQAPEKCDAKECAHNCHPKALCDPRSLCFASNTGTGVQCSCDIPLRNLITRPGTLPDGRQCM